MRYLFMAAVLVAASSGRSLFVADSIPEFKIESCRAAEESGSAARNAPACFQDEQNAKDTLQKNWSRYDSTQKGHCQRLMKAGGKPSYVELLTCVEMKTGPAGPPTDAEKKRKGL